MIPINIYEFVYQLFGVHLGQYNGYLMFASGELCSMVVAAVAYGIWDVRQTERGTVIYGRK